MAEGNKKSWVLQKGGQVYTNLLDATAFGETNRTYLIDAPSLSGSVSSFTVTFGDEPKPEPGIEVDSTGYTLSGEFQGIQFDVGALDSIKDNPIDAVVRDVLDLADDEELIGISYRDASGQVKVRPWFVD